MSDGVGVKTVAGPAEGRTMDGLDLDKLRDVAEQASAWAGEPWVFSGSYGESRVDADGDERCVGEFMYREDAEFIAACAPSVALALLDEVDRLRAEIGRVAKAAWVEGHHRGWDDRDRGRDPDASQNPYDSRRVKSEGA